MRNLRFSGILEKDNAESISKQIASFLIEKVPPAGS